MSGEILLAGLDNNYKPFIMGIEAAGKNVTSDMIISKLIDSQTEKRVMKHLQLKISKDSLNDGVIIACSDRVLC